MSKTISILGATGSIGRQTLDVAEQLGLRVAALTANSNAERLEAQARKFRPRLAVLTDEAAAKDLAVRLAVYDLCLREHHVPLILDDALAASEGAVIDCSAGLELLPAMGHEGHDHDTEYDPHIWMDPACAQDMMAVIAQGLGEALYGDDWASHGEFHTNQLVAKDVLEQARQRLEQAREDLGSRVADRALLDCGERLRELAGRAASCRNALAAIPGLCADRERTFAALHPASAATKAVASPNTSKIPTASAILLLLYCSRIICSRSRS